MSRWVTKPTKMIFLLIIATILLLSISSEHEIDTDTHALETLTASGVTTPLFTRRITWQELNTDPYQYIDQYIELHGIFLGMADLVTAAGPNPHIDWTIGYTSAREGERITPFNIEGGLGVDNTFNGKLENLAHYSEVTIWGWLRAPEWYFEAVYLRIDEVYQPKK